MTEPPLTSDELQMYDLILQGIENNEVHSVKLARCMLQMILEHCEVSTLATLLKGIRDEAVKQSAATQN